MEIKLPSLLPKNDKFRVGAFRLITLLAMSAPIVILAAFIRGLPSRLTVPANSGEFWALVEGSAAVATLSITIGVGFIAWYGLRSIRLSRQDMVDRATREARTLAIERGKEFRAFLNGRHRELWDALNAENVPAFARQLKPGMAIFDDPAVYPIAKAWWRAIPQGLQTSVIDNLNELEAWSMWFTHELADSDVLFEPCAPTFCSIVVQSAAWIIVVRKEQYAYYPNVLRLFNAWSAELDKKAGGSTTEAAIKAALVAAERAEKHRIGRPIGTKVDL